MAATRPKRRRPVFHRFDKQEVVSKSHPMAPLLKNQLIVLVKTNVLRLKYTKRDGTTRYMWCTASRKILDTYEAADLYDFIKPTGKLPYDISQTDNIVVWDLEKCAWRTVNATRAQISIAIPDDIFIARMKLAKKDILYFIRNHNLLYGLKTQSKKDRALDQAITDKFKGQEREFNNWSSYYDY